MDDRPMLNRAFEPSGGQVELGRVEMVSWPLGAVPEFVPEVGGEFVYAGRVLRVVDRHETASRCVLTVRELVGVVFR